MSRPVDVKQSYDRVAANYAAQFHDELAQKPLDREMLDRLVEGVGGLGPICDMGCGPGQIARYLHQHGASACGLDLSPEMVRQAQRLAPDIPFRQGDMCDLSAIANDAFGGIAAFYSIIHVPRAEVPRALSELYRVLRPGGLLLLTFHIGQETRHLDEWWGEPVALDFHFFETEEMTSHLRSASFAIDAVLKREPYPAVEVQTRRPYLFARKRPG